MVCKSRILQTFSTKQHEKFCQTHRERNVILLNHLAQKQYLPSHNSLSVYWFYIFTIHVDKSQKTILQSEITDQNYLFIIYMLIKLNVQLTKLESGRGVKKHRQMDKKTHALISQSRQSRDLIHDEQSKNWKYT